MQIDLHRTVDVTVNRRGGIQRREFLRGISAAGVATGALSWTDLMTVEAARLRKRGMACILLWMQGGPSQFETFSPRLDHVDGETGAISTSVPGIQISENLPQTAQVMDEVCVIRSVNSKEGSHPRASFLLHTGYVPIASVRHPTLGSLISHQIGDPNNDLPGFVRVGKGDRGAAGGGILGVQFEPFAMSSADRRPENTSFNVDSTRFGRRLRLLDRLETQKVTPAMKQEAADHQGLYERASRLVTSRDMRAFDISSEPDKIRTAYGSSTFSNSCLLARRLVESGVTFVEVTHGNWDTHQDNFERSRQLCEEMDRPYAQLLRDLDQRGLLQNTLVIWMGEFGRTPNVNGRGGRDHYPRAFNIALAGGGVQGGQVIGATDSDGREVTERPVGVSDLFQTFCHSLNIDPDHENMSPIGRPIKIVESGEVVNEVFG